MSEEWAVSPNYKFYASMPGHVVDTRTGKSNAISALETKVALFEDRANGWFLEVARGLCKRHGGYAVLQIATSQVKGLQQFIEGRGSKRASRETFVRGMITVFPDAVGHESMLGEFYQRVRCGLFHDGLTKSNVAISWDYPPLAFDGSVILINPRLFLENVAAAVARYVRELRDAKNRSLRANFQSRWDQMTR